MEAAWQAKLAAKPVPSQEGTFPERLKADRAALARWRATLTPAEKCIDRAMRPVIVIGDVPDDIESAG